MKRQSNILGPNGQPLVVDAQRVTNEKLTRFNPLRTLTPESVGHQLEAYARGDIARLSWTMDWMERHDETICTVAPKAKGAVSRYGFDVLLRDEIRPEQRQMAEDQRGRLQAFYESIEVGDAVELEEAGGFRLLVTGIMDAYGKGYAAHHIQWLPSANGLSARLVKIPAWFWECRTGKLRFLQSPWAIEGTDRDELGGPSAWLISKGRGVMLAGVIARMFKQLPMQDWLTYCDRHGMPAFIGKTSAAKGSPGWLSMVNAVAGVGSEFGAVINTGDVIDVLSLTGQGEVPYEKIVDRMTRALIMLWRGGDLSTLSKSDGVGGNAQSEDSDELDGDNAQWVAETLDRNLSKQVIRYYFGQDAPMLVRLQLRTKTRQNVREDLDTVKAAKEMGVRVSEPWFLSKFGVVAADVNEKALGEAVPAPQVPALNSAESTALLTKSLGKALGVRSEVLAPVDALIQRLASSVQDGSTTDAEWLQFVESAAMDLPELFDPELADELAADLEAAMGTAVIQGVRETLTKPAN